ncbi:MAG: glycosyltransferase family 39 protein [Thermoleophilia bacterium]|nr:glycosyltransferase family 39 protein [Thermoleophilia bacterium]
MNNPSSSGTGTREGLFASPRWVWATVALLTLIGALVRIKTAGSSLFGDELSTLWIVDGRSLKQVIEIVNSDAEITPPLYFVLAWMANKLGSDPDLIRLPALIAGIGAIPLTYAIGLRMIGRLGALVATAVVTVSPFLVFYSADARAYSVGITMLLLSTLGLLLAAETGRRRWWALYGVASLLALYSHYTMAFVLIGQLLWLLWAFPSARKSAIVTNAIAAVFYLPWIGGFLADNGSITVPILEALQGDGFDSKKNAVEQVVFSRQFTGVWALGRAADVWLISLGVLIAAGGASVRWVFGRVKPVLEGLASKGLVLAAVLTLSTAIGEAILLTLGDDIFGGRNLAATWVGLPFLLGSVVMMNTRFWAALSATLMLAGFAYGTARITDPVKSSLPYSEASDYTATVVADGGVAIDAAHFTPSPMSAANAYLPSSVTLYRPGLPALDEVDFINRILVPKPRQPVVDEAFADADGGPVAVMTFGGPDLATDRQFIHDKTGGVVEVPEGWSITAQEEFEGLQDLTVTTYERKAGK